MSMLSLADFSPTNRRQIGLLIAGHLLWSGAVFGLSRLGSSFAFSTWLALLFLALQLHAAVQLQLSALSMSPEPRTRGFYYLWGGILGAAIWGSSLLTPSATWQTLLVALRSGLLLLTATVIGHVLARYVRRLWEIFPVCVVITLADLLSWRYGPTGDFARQIEQHALKPEGPPPLVDMVLIKLAQPGSVNIVPVFGISDWIMVAFFVAVARRFEINDNLFGPPGGPSTERRLFGRYLPIPAAALFAAILLAQSTGFFIPALPVIAIVMLGWYAIRARQHT